MSCHLVLICRRRIRARSLAELKYVRKDLQKLRTVIPIWVQIEVTLSGKVHSDFVSMEDHRWVLQSLRGSQA